MFGFYRVDSVIFEITAMLKVGTTSPTQAVVLGMYVNTPDDGFTLTGATWTDGQQNPYFHHRILSATGSQQVVVRHRFTIEQLSGLTKRQFQADHTDYSATTLASPNRICSLQIAIASPDTYVATNNTVTYSIKLTMNSLLWGRLDIPDSP